MARAWIEPDGDRIHQRRRALGLSQDAVAAKAKVNKKTFQKAENGKRISLASLKLIAAALNAQLIEFFPADQRPVVVATKECVLEIYLDEGFYTSLDQAREWALQRVIAIAKQEVPEVRIRMGSIKLQMRMSRHAALRVLEATDSGEFDLPGLLKVVLRRHRRYGAAGAFESSPTRTSFEPDFEGLAALLREPRDPEDERWKELAALVARQTIFFPPSWRYPFIQPHDAQDLAQEVLTRLYTMTPEVITQRSERMGHFMHFLRSLITNTVWNWSRRNYRRRPRVDFVDPTEKVLSRAVSPPERPTETDRLEIRETLMKAFGRVHKPSYLTWEVFERVCIERPPYQEVAEGLGVGASALMQAFSRLRRALRTELIRMGWTSLGGFPS